MKHFKFSAKCRSCEGTGIYQGVCERDGFGVVCSTCHGTGLEIIEINFEPFEGRIETDKVKWVLQANTGIVAGINDELKYEDFGGIPYEDWLSGKGFPPGTEMRKFNCPAWWYQSVNYKLKPQWDECIGCGSFSRCEYFKRKEICWKRWDNEIYAHYQDEQS